MLLIDCPEFESQQGQKIFLFSTWSITTLHTEALSHRKLPPAATQRDNEDTIKRSVCVSAEWCWHNSGVVRAAMARQGALPRAQKMKKWGAGVQGAHCVPKLKKIRVSAWGGFCPFWAHCIPAHPWRAMAAL